MNLDTVHTITLDTITFDVKLNVKDIYTDVFTGNKTYNHYTTSSENLKNYVFFAFESPYHNAFAHWIFESAVFLPFVTYFNSIPNFYILVNKNYARKYKELFFKMFNITSDRIWLIDNDPTVTNHISYENIPENNTCIVCKNFTLNTKTIPDHSFKIFKYLINSLHNDIVKKIETSTEKSIDNLFLPRNKKENFKPNDRKIDYATCERLLKSVQYTCYDTSDTEDFTEQIRLLHSSKNIYLCWGSAYLVNGFFSNNSTLFVICNENPYRYHHEYSLVMYIYDFIENKNNQINVI